MMMMMIYDRRQLLLFSQVGSLPQRLRVQLMETLGILGALDPFQYKTNNQSSLTVAAKTGKFDVPTSKSHQNHIKITSPQLYIIKC